MSLMDMDAEDKIALPDSDLRNAVANELVCNLEHLGQLDGRFSDSPDSITQRVIIGQREVHLTVRVLA